MTDQGPANTTPAASTGSLIGAIMLGMLGVIFLLSCGCFGIFGIVFLSQGQGIAIVLVGFALIMGVLTFFTFMGVRSVLLRSYAAAGIAQSESADTTQKNSKAPRI